MDFEKRQSEILHQYSLLAKGTHGRATTALVHKATSEPGLFSFAELIYAAPISALKETDQSAALELLHTFAYGTWTEYKDSINRPELNEAQKLKLKQLTVMSLAENLKVLPYELLMKELDIENVRQLEDFLINDCMYAGIVRGKLDQKRRCLDVHFAAGRDLQPGKIEQHISVLSDWLATCEALLASIENKIEWAESQSAKQAEHRKEVEERVEEAKKAIAHGALDASGGLDGIFGEGSGNMMADFVEEADRNRPKRRR